jgi:hypothetical protein
MFVWGHVDFAQVQKLSGISEQPNFPFKIFKSFRYLVAGYAGIPPHRSHDETPCLVEHDVRS